MSVPCQIGDRIELIQMGKDPDPIPAGTKGRVREISPLSGDLVVIKVQWDINRGLALIWPTDQFRVVRKYQ